MATKNKAADLNTMFEELEEVIAGLEGDNISLEESFALYSKGMKAVKECSKTIDKIEKKVMVLDGSGELKEFE